MSTGTNDCQLYMTSGTNGRALIKATSGGVFYIMSTTSTTARDMAFYTSTNQLSLTLYAAQNAVFNGNVQIGSGTATEKLHVFGNIKTSGHISGVGLTLSGNLTAASGSIAAGGAVSGASFATIGNISTTAGNISGVGLTLTGDITSSVAASGTFNIKTTNTSNINIISGLNTAIAINTSGIVTTIKGWTNTSDGILKDNQEIAPLNELEDILNNVDVKTYTRNDMDNEYEIGFVAQELEAVLTDKYHGLVKDVNVDVGFGEQTYKSVDYSRMTCILWGIVKNQQQRIQTLEDIIIAIDEKISKA